MKKVSSDRRPCLHVGSFIRLSILLVISLFPVLSRAQAPVLYPSIEFDRGRKGLRVFQPTDACVEKPCILTEWGAIRLPKEIGNTYRLELGMHHRGSYRSIALFEKSTTLEQKFSQRVFTRRPNREILDLERQIEWGKAPVIYMYGLLLQHEFDEGDLLALKLTSLKDPRKVDQYFFRYHHQGANWDIDIAFVQPISLFTPNPGDVIQAAYSTGAISLSVGWAMDPEKKYNIFTKALHAVRFNLFSGLLLRRDVFARNGDNITKDYLDGFGGLGVTFFDFLAMGYGANIARSPHTTFPFVGIEVRHLMEFLRSLKKDTHTRWERYLKAEMEKEEARSYEGEPTPLTQKRR